MKKIIISLLLSLTILVPINAFSYTYPYNYKWKYKKSDVFDNMYYNVNINNMLYNIIIWKDGDYEVELNFSKIKGDTLNVPDTIFFRGKNLKVKKINIDDLLTDSTNSKWKMPYKNVSIPNSITEADFNHVKFTNIEKKYISKNVQKLSGLSGYPKLKVIIDKNNPNIKMKNGALYSKDGKKLIELVNSKKKYRVSNGTKLISFSKVKSIEKVYLPSSLKKISFYAFYECKNLKKLKINNKTKIIDSSAFEKCESLNNIVLPKNLEKINSSAFKNCKSLEKIEMPKKIEKIKYWAFKNCIKLSKVIIESKDKVPIIEDSAFKNTKNGIQFIVKNQTIADQLKEQLKGTGVKNAKILIGKKVVYQNING